LAHLALGAVALPAVLLLQLAGQVLAVALGDIEHVVGQVAPLGLGLALELGPLAGNDVFVHGRSSSLGKVSLQRLPHRWSHLPLVRVTARSRIRKMPFTCVAGGPVGRSAEKKRPAFAGLCPAFRDGQRGSVPPVSSADSCILSPTFSTSLPTPLTVLQALSMPTENMATSIMAIKRFIWILLNWVRLRPRGI